MKAFHVGKDLALSQGNVWVTEAASVPWYKSGETGKRAEASEYIQLILLPMERTYHGGEKEVRTQTPKQLRHLFS